MKKGLGRVGAYLFGIALSLVGIGVTIFSIFNIVNCFEGLSCVMAGRSLLGPLTFTFFGILMIIGGYLIINETRSEEERKTN